MERSLNALAAAVLHVGPRPERVLEVGCAGGDGTLFLAREFPAARVRGLDPSEDAIRAATARIGLDPEGRVAFKAGGTSSLPYPDDFFDLVVHSRGRLPSAEAARVLRSGGDLTVVQTPGVGPASMWRGLRRRRLARRGFRLLERGETQGERFLVFRLEKEGDGGRIG